MAKYRKKPVVVEAEEYKEGMEDGFECRNIIDIIKKHIPQEECDEECWHEKGLICLYRTPYINTLEGKHYISKGDYIITGVRGERYPCKPDIFKETYVPAEKTDSEPNNEKQRRRINKMIAKAEITDDMVVKAKIENGVIKCMSRVCGEISCPNYDKCKTYKIATVETANPREEIVKICNEILPFVDDSLAAHIEKILKLAKGGQTR